MTKKLWQKLKYLENEKSELLRWNKKHFSSFLKDFQSSKWNNFFGRLEFDFNDEHKRQTYNQFHNILRLFDVLPNFPFTLSETMGDYYL